MIDAEAGTDDFRTGAPTRPRGRHGTARGMPLLPLLCCIPSAALAQVPQPPPPQLAAVIEVRIVSHGPERTENGRGWAVERETPSGRTCLVLTPWHVVSDDRTDVANDLRETRVLGVSANDVGVKAVRIEHVHPTLDLARVTLDSNRGCPFGPANDGRLPQQGLALWWLNDRGGVDKLDGDESQGVLHDDESGDTAKAYLREAGVVEGMSGATVFVNGRRAGMLTNAPGQARRFGYLTAKGIQRALGSELALFDLGAADVKPTAAAEPAFPPVDTRKVPAKAEASVLGAAAKPEIPPVDAREVPRTIEPAFKFIDARKVSAKAEASVLSNDAKLADFALFKDCPDCPGMVVIPSGRFMMGEPASESKKRTDARPRHRVEIKRFALARTEVTVAEFRNFVQAAKYVTDAENNLRKSGCYVVMDLLTFSWVEGTSWRDPGFRQEEDHPVACISWNDAKAYVDWLSKQTGKDYRLPSEAEFEYALRAGSDSLSHWNGDDGVVCLDGNIKDRRAFASSPVALFSMVDCDDGHMFTAPVKSYRASRYGLFDIEGNISEWVADCLNANYHGAPADGRAWMAGDCDSAMLRGSSWGLGVAMLHPYLRTWSHRDDRSNQNGFRPARSLTR